MSKDDEAAAAIFKLATGSEPRGKTMPEMAIELQEEIERSKARLQEWKERKLT